MGNTTKKYPWHPWERVRTCREDLDKGRVGRSRANLSMEKYYVPKLLLTVFKLFCA